MSKEISNDQLFEFMTKMYGEMQDMKENMATKDDLANTNQAIAKTNQAIVRLENKMDEEGNGDRSLFPPFTASSNPR